MTLIDPLLDAYQWLEDCGGQMALSNNPMAYQLIAAGLAKKGGYNNLGQRTLVIIPKPKTPHSPAELAKFFQQLPTGSGKASSMAEEALKMYTSLPDSRDKKGPLCAGWAEMILWVPSMIAWDGKAYRKRNKDRQVGGLAIMSPPTWVYLTTTFESAEFESRDEYVMAGLLGTLSKKTAVLTDKTFPARKVVFINHEFTEKTTFTADKDPIP